MSRVLFTLWPFTGHLLPQMAIAVALRERGHEVAFYSGRGARATIEDEGFEVPRLRAHRPGAGVSRTCARWRRRHGPGPAALAGGCGRCCATGWSRPSPTRSRTCGAVVAAGAPRRDRDGPVALGPDRVLWETERIPVALVVDVHGTADPGPGGAAVGLGHGPAQGPARRARPRRAVTRATELGGRPPAQPRRRDPARQHGLGPMREPVNRFTGRLPLYLVGSVAGARLRARRSCRRASTTSATARNCGSRWDAATSACLAAVPEGRPWVHVTESTLASGDPFLLRAAVAGARRACRRGGRPRPAAARPTPPRRAAAQRPRRRAGSTTTSCSPVRGGGHRRRQGDDRRRRFRRACRSSSCRPRGTSPTTPVAWSRRARACGCSARQCTPERAAGGGRSGARRAGPPRARAAHRGAAGGRARAPGAAELLEALATGGRSRRAGSSTEGGR